MSDTERQILTPGDSAPAADTASPARRKPGPKSAAEKAAAAAATAGAAGVNDDLAEFDDDELPTSAPVANAESFSPAQQAIIAQMIAQAVQASKASQDPKTAAKLAAAANTKVTLPTQSEAMAMCNDQVAKGTRPRPILTPDGWYVHPESVRTVDHGVAKLAVS